MLREYFNVKTLAASAVVFAGSVIGANGAAYGTGEEPEIKPSPSAATLSDQEIKAQKIRALLNGAVNLTADEVDERFEKVEEALEPIPDDSAELFRDPVIAKALFDGGRPLLHHDNYSVRMDAVFIIGQIAAGQPSCSGHIISLLELLKYDEDRYVRENAAGTISGIKAEAGVNQSQNCPLGTAEELSKNLSEAKARAVKLLFADVDILYGDEVQDALQNLKKLSGKEGFEDPVVAEAIFDVAAPLLKHEDAMVRYDALMSTTMIGAAHEGCAVRAISLVKSLETDPDKNIREWAAVMVEGLLDKYGLGIDDLPQDGDPAAKCVFDAPRP